MKTNNTAVTENPYVAALVSQYEYIQTCVSNYYKDFKPTLERFLKENKLDGDVLDTSKNAIGFLEIVVSDEINAACPYIVRFHPYRKNGATGRRYTDIYLCTRRPDDYFTMILERYTPLKNERTTFNA